MPYSSHNYTMYSDEFQFIMQGKKKSLTPDLNLGPPSNHNNMHPLGYESAALLGLHSRKYGPIFASWKVAWCTEYVCLIFLLMTIEMFRNSRNLIQGKYWSIFPTVLGFVSEKEMQIVPFTSRGNYCCNSQYHWRRLMARLLTDFYQSIALSEGGRWKLSLSLDSKTSQPIFDRPFL